MNKLIKKGSAFLLTVAILSAIAVLSSALTIFYVAQDRMNESINDINKEKINISNQFSKNYKYLISGESFISDDNNEIKLKDEILSLAIDGIFQYNFETYTTKIRKTDESLYSFSLEKEKNKIKYFFERKLVYENFNFSLVEGEIIKVNE